MTQAPPLVDHTSGELAITWEQYHRLIEHLALQVHNAQAGFDQVVALSRGGLRVGDALSRIFQTPLVVMAASSYEGEGDRNQGSLTLGSQLAHTCSKLGPRLLLVDDLADSGATLIAARQWLADTLPGAEIKTAVLWHKASSTVQPDFWAMELPHNPWVLQPFEHWDQLRPQQLEPIGTHQSSTHSLLG
ncbi:phosphoribosyltransferase [Synechococcus sp. RS9916]|uniref:phosphoribosyltransferase n=1 Tax=Synechococcus sp. RS9916 TaxID=221359 RepID=UPI0000E5471A|nr:phosphoribosyltransferase family protein [Synechococcus sp. RS9916]EAU72777.1 purine phosphoribosyltransferase, putative [Synechococcus sp. RS9916]